jgi:hypothetical protein
MSARITQEGLLPEKGERRKIVEQAGTVLAQARSLLENLDQTGGRLHVRSASVLNQRPIVIGRSSASDIGGSVHWKS